MEEGSGVMAMKTIAAKVLDSTHLELDEPLDLRPGAQVAVAVSESARETIGSTPSRSQSLTAIPFRRSEHDWRRSHGDLLRRYAGHWVVLEGEEIVSHGDDPVELVATARTRGIRSPYLFFVEPRQPGVVRIGL